MQEWPIWMRTKRTVLWRVSSNRVREDGRFMGVLGSACNEASDQEIAVQGRKDCALLFHRDEGLSVLIHD